LADILQRIMAERRADADAARRAVPPETLAAAIAARTPRSLADRLRAGPGPHMIAEMKKASPSAGLLRPDYRPNVIAREYADAGAIALSVLTEPRHFLGERAHLDAARAACHLPVLRKDFLADPYQVLESAAWGADVILLIVAGLARPRLREMYAAALDCGLDVLAEAHTAEELDRALELDQALIGINSRDLKTLKTDLDVARQLAAHIPADRLAIAESGIRTRADIQSLLTVGYRGFLVGEVLMAAPSPGNKLRELRGAPPASPETAHAR
jgi:indole-3-glycerol phosphate synthase